MTPYFLPGPLVERQSTKALEQASRAGTVSDLAFWLHEARRYNAPTRAVCDVLLRWCRARAGVVAVVALAVTE